MNKLRRFSRIACQKKMMMVKFNMPVSTTKKTFLLLLWLIENYLECSIFKNVSKFMYTVFVHYSKKKFFFWRCSMILIRLSINLMFKYYIENIFLLSFYVSFMLWSLEYVCIYVNNKHHRSISENRILEKHDGYGTTLTLDYIESYPNRYTDRSPNFDIFIWLKQHFCPRRQQVINHKTCLFALNVFRTTELIYSQESNHFIVFFLSHFHSIFGGNVWSRTDRIDQHRIDSFHF